ncbi:MULTISPECIES: hypothetical protein [Pseudomonas]|uniref:Uncharacterized protein n=1 Tax=Pseudomonas fluorescens TaxID=294 RepID=A0A109KH66_PSEFL|nr:MULTISPECIES: hypothetical protein [Pseudomonas]KWV69166.1 hypothetical protein PFLmoz3_06282 [Pseudomonas fluorescens]PRW86040.1 hypothetical protein C7A10_25905 [Pseudomonas fluorescens]
MNNFNNRIDAQRNILRIVNERHWYVEELSGLSNKAIDRWMLANQIDAASRLAELIRLAGRALFFLANKSQEQVTDEYEHHSQKVVDLTYEIAKEIQNLY